LTKDETSRKTGESKETENKQKVCEGILIRLVLEADKVLQEIHIPECLAADHCEVPTSAAYTPSPSVSNKLKSQDIL